MNDSLNICLPCGLCCDGTLIGYVQLERDEVPRLKELIDLEDENGHGFILQPCNKFDKACTIYSQRSKQCASFKCEFLKSVEQKELDFDLAIKIIKEVKQKVIAIEKKVEILPFELQSKSFYFKMVELKKVLHKNKSESSITQNQLELISDLELLDNLLLKHFGITLD